MTIDELDKKDLIVIIRNLIGSNFHARYGDNPTLSYRCYTLTLTNSEDISISEIKNHFIDLILTADFPEKQDESNDNT